MINTELSWIVCYFSAAINTLISVVVSVLVFSKNHKSKLYRSFIFFSLCFGLWSYIYSLWFLSMSEPTFARPLLLLRVSSVLAIVATASFMEFVFRLLKLESAYLWLRVGNALIAAVLACSTFSHLWIESLQPLGIFRYSPQPGILFYGFNAWYAANMILMNYVMIRSLSSERSTVSRRRTKLVFFAALIGLIGSVTNFFLWYGISIPPFGNVLIGVYLGMTAYALLRYKLIDIEVIVRRTLVFAGLFTFVFSVFVVVTFFVQSVITKSFQVSDKWFNLLSVFIIITGFDPLRNALINLTDHFLFQKKSDYQKLLRDASNGMSSIKSLNHLCSLAVHFITMRVRVRNAGVLSRVVGTDRFTLTHRRGYATPPLLETIMADDPLVRFLETEREPLVLDRVDEWIELGGSSSDRRSEQNRIYDFKIIKNRMAVLRASACIPSFFQDELRNVLILGEKKSSDYFSNEDLDVLFTLAQESAIAIENARLYDEAVLKSKELSIINRELELAQTSLISALNETELANKRLQDTQAQLIHEQKMATLGRLASSVGHEVNNPLTILSMNVSRAILKYRKDPNLRVADILDVFQKMEQNIGRIKAVVNTLTGLLKKSEKGKFEALSLKLILEETLPLVQFQTYLDNLTGTEVQFDIPGNVPLIRGDLERLQEVFLNLFINAYHAMTGRRERKISVTAHQSESNSKFVVIEFADNGCGMTEDVQKKIFQYGFTTKPVGKGSGMGLYMCRYIIELHGGEIRVRSKANEGTTFVITLPTFEEESGVMSAELPDTNKKR